uniref:FYVE-type domain-containing protein n=2 Tax=Photinus pyralis TaxID=7054 RepID=A0A1Y1N123_PHOPY
MENCDPKADSSEALHSKVVKLETDNKMLREEFDIQRAKLKDLFLQKEGELERKSKDYESLSQECDKVKLELEDVKSQLLVTGITLKSSTDMEERKMEEIASLQQLVHETIEESSNCKTIYAMELKKLHDIIRRLESENGELKAGRQQSPQRTIQEPSSLVPSLMLNAVTKTLARKLGADTFNSQDTVEENMCKVHGDDHAQEDVEVLRSLLVPLEEEIKALKDKLRSADDLLQKCQCKHTGVETSANPSLHATATNTSFEGRHTAIAQCDMCSNYETELVKEQKHTEDIKLKLLRAEKAVDRHREELLKEIGFREEIEEKWNEKKEQHKLQVAELTTRTDCAEQDLKELQDVFKHTMVEVRQQLTVITNEREKVQHELEKLQRENEDLVGKYSVHSQQLQSEAINLPNVVEDLQELILRGHQELIIAKIAKEVVEEEVDILRSDNLLLKDEITMLKDQTEQLEAEKQRLLSTQDKLKSLDKIHQATLAQIDELSGEKNLLEDQNNELKSRVASLQQELDNSETVQKDFVRLSQSLQVQLEKIRDADTQVRWQHEEDVEDCPSCRSMFNVTKRKKQHCRHCGQIFCLPCLNHTVCSGPNQRPSKVCDVCHTLLVKSSAPYFSTEVPHSPD